MDNILTELVGPERAQQLQDTPTLNLVHENLRLVHFSIIPYRHRRNELYIELAARLTGVDLLVCQEEIRFLTSHLTHLQHLFEKLYTYLNQNQYVLWVISQGSQS